MSQRVARQASSTGLYHIFVRGINRERIFEQAREKQYFKRIIKKCLKKLEQYGIEIHAYCIMSNHAHLVIKSDQKEKLSYFMSNILTEYAQYYNYKHNRNGHVFQNRFGSECIEDERYYWNCIKYVHMNPVKALMVPSVLEYKYTSIGEYRSGRLAIIHPNAYHKYKERFKNVIAYMEFHGIANEQIFIGMLEEVKAQRMEVALSILWKMKEQKHLDEIQQILEEPALRKQFMKQIERKLGLSKNGTCKLYTDIKKKYIDK